MLDVAPRCFPSISFSTMSLRPLLAASLVMSAFASSSFCAAAASSPGGSALPPKVASHTAPYTLIGKIERLDPALDALISPEATFETLAEGFTWSEGPVWSGGAKDGYLLFSDVPENRIYRWDPRTGLSVFHSASGFSGTAYNGRERGSNGLTLDPQGRLVACQHGDRRIARLDADGKTFTALADRYDGKRFNSPNDLCFDKRGNLFFTDPPYGLAPSSTREIEYHGVYRVTPDGKVTLLTKDLERPNGVALSPDQKTLYVANSHRPRPVIMAYPLRGDGTLGEGRVLFDAKALSSDTTRKGLPDGLKVDVKGNLWATGPGGVLILSPQGKHLGTLLTGRATANCAWGDDGKTLYMTAHTLLLRVRTQVKGL